jgi:hypothetical protein
MAVFRSLLVQPPAIETHVIVKSSAGGVECMMKEGGTGAG